MELVNELLDFSKSEAGHFAFKPTISDLIKVLEQEIHTFSPLAKGKNIKLSYIYKEASLLCIADTVIIQKIVSNLLSNAIKHTPEEGIINVYLEGLR